MKKFVLSVIAVILLIWSPGNQTQAKTYVTTVYKNPVSVTYVWKQSFKERVAKNSISTKNIYMTEYDKTTRIPLSISLLKGEKIIQIKPTKALKNGQKYALVIENVKSVKGKVLTKPLRKIFTTVKKPVAVKPQPAITSTIVKTTNKTVTGVIAEKNGKITITYDFRSCKDQEIIEDSSLTASQNYRLTFKKVPPTVSLFIPENYSEKLIKGKNKLQITEKMKEYKAQMGLIRMGGNLILEGTLTDDAGRVKPITLTFTLK
ncbi:Ig-like domain-containing protein [Bacillus sp. V5-8f]|uniref:Ig-like domain-containing protein n=1 Tax=Bacillus sp. V5-8f TaxID=2053044 RepID=UPI000C763A1D|nr:Ig-like domain-containing protein [Bacillus sp. V5-8f]PLT35766.1 hypothetical protein CUU64_00360 [Bacillus sp. V5-8f]